MEILLRAVAKRKSATPAQIALAWLLAQKLWIVPIPGTRKLEHLDENLRAAEIELTSDFLSEIDRAFPAFRRAYEADRPLRGAKYMFSGCTTQGC